MFSEGNNLQELNECHLVSAKRIKYKVTKVAVCVFRVCSDVTSLLKQQQVG